MVGCGNCGAAIAIRTCGPFANHSDVVQALSLVSQCCVGDIAESTSPIVNPTSAFNEGFPDGLDANCPCDIIWLVKPSGSLFASGNGGTSWLQVGELPFLHNYTATSAPTTNDDSGAGYSVGSLWYDLAHDLAYTCLDNTPTAAVWQLITTGVRAVLEHQEASGTNGGTYTSGSWQTLELTNEVSDPKGIVSLSSNEFTPIAGRFKFTYDKIIKSRIANDTNFRIRLYNVTQAAEVVRSINMNALAAQNLVISFSDMFEANGSDAYRLELYPTQTTTADISLGSALSTGETEIYGRLTLESR